MKNALVALALAIPAAGTAQPYSESMADCASLFQNAAQWVQTDELSDRLMYSAVQWHAAAVSQAKTEGDTISDAGMWDKVDAKTEVWEAKGAGFMLTEEFRDWSSYCKSFAKHMNIAYKP